MRNMIFVLMLTGFLSGCHAQHQDPIKKNPEPQQNEAAPEGSWRVNKEFDENGNLIRYDSVYSWSSDGMGKMLSPEAIDSLIGSMPSIFGRNGDPFSGHLSQMFRNDPFLSQFFQGDSLPSGTPFGYSPFGHWMMNDSLWINRPDHDRIMEEMERMHRDFMHQFRPKPLIPAEEDSIRRF